MSKIVGSSKISVRFQVTIPEDVRNFLNLEPGEMIGFLREGDKIVLTNEIPWFFYTYIFSGFQLLLEEG